MEEIRKKIYDFVRAQSDPYPGAYSYYKNKKVTISKMKVFDHPVYGIPGSVCIIDSRNHSIVVACGQNTGVVIDQVQIDGIDENIDKIVNQNIRFSDSLIAI